MTTYTINFNDIIGGHTKQEKIWQDNHRFIDIMAGRRGGKDWIGVRKALKNIYTRDLGDKSKENINFNRNHDVPRLHYWFIAPTYQLTKVITKHLFQFLDERLIQVDKTNSNQPHLWLFPDIKIEFKSAERPENLVGEGLNGVYVTETARLKSKVWNDNVRPTLTDKGGWGIFTTTPLGHNWYIDEIRCLSDKANEQYDDEYVGYHWKTVENTKNPLLLKEVERAKKTMPKKYFLRNYEACADAFQGQIFDDFDRDIHVKKWSIDKSIYKVIIGGMDWGYTHHGGFVVIGITNDDEVHVLEENTQPGIPCVSSDATQDTWAKRAFEAQKKWGWELLYCGVDEPEHIKALRDEGVYARKAKNAVNPGIQTIATLMHVDENGYTRLKIHENCKRLAKYLPAYRWAENRDGNLEERPEKINDDEVDMLRYAVHSARRWLKLVVPPIEEEENAA